MSKLIKLINKLHREYTKETGSEMRDGNYIDWLEDYIINTDKKEMMKENDREELFYWKDAEGNELYIFDMPSKYLENILSYADKEQHDIILKELIDRGVKEYSESWHDVLKDEVMDYTVEMQKEFEEKINEKD